MSYLLPLEGTPERDLIDVKHIAYILDPRNVHKLSTLTEARMYADDVLARNHDISSINIVCRLELSGVVVLMKFHREGHEPIWNFSGE